MQLTFHKGKTATRQRHTGRSARGGPRRRRSSWRMQPFMTGPRRGPTRTGREVERISDKGVILKAFSLCGQGLHRRIGGLWPSAMSACRRDYARAQHRRATAVRAAQISQILGGKSANLSQVDVSRRTQWRGLPQHLAGTVRPLALVRVVVSATSQPCHPAAKTNATKIIGLRSNGSRSKARSNVIARRLWRCEDPHPIHLARVHHRSSTGWAPTSLAGARCEAFRL